MDFVRVITTTRGESNAASTALDYYLDTITKCTRHPADGHGDEADCEGWGPKELAQLEDFAKKVRLAAY